MVMVTMAWAQARKYTGNCTVVGPAYFEHDRSRVRAIADRAAGWSRQAAAVSAELGAM